MSCLTKEMLSDASITKTVIEAMLEAENHKLAELHKAEAEWKGLDVRSWARTQQFSSEGRAATQRVYDFHNVRVNIDVLTVALEEAS